MSSPQLASTSELQASFDYENPPELTLNDYYQILPLLNSYKAQIPKEVATHINSTDESRKNPEPKDILLICRTLLNLWVYSNTGEEKRQKVCSAIRREIFNTFGIATTSCICTMKQRASIIAAAGGADQLRVLKERFNVPYKDDNQFLYSFVSYLNSLVSDGFRKQYYSSSVAVLQSSYSGKSRLMSRLAELLPMAYICCPEKSVLPSYPLQTPIDWEMLFSFNTRREMPARTDFFILARCISFLNTLALFCASVALKCRYLLTLTILFYLVCFIVK